MDTSTLWGALTTWRSTRAFRSSSSTFCRGWDDMSGDDEDDGSSDDRDDESNDDGDDEIHDVVDEDGQGDNEDKERSGVGPARSAKVGMTGPVMTEMACLVTKGMTTEMTMEMMRLMMWPMRMGRVIVRTTRTTRAFKSWSSTLCRGWDDGSGDDGDDGSCDKGDDRSSDDGDDKSDDDGDDKIDDVADEDGQGDSEDGEMK
ncbi:hypothetical protein D8674_011168 [Pyrus ussuriensis x Pyrus communis]|uniref:Uncharacterized protein n=1 Tax=Pyrus ussuriensis x Pyrus communis TaxID=2448454 RepID=A0A5N5G2S8_9ROSA|nr:hypothetical protein D8674_011168 [Pyrus ussuriensis x Pyrus communis]